MLEIWHGDSTRVALVSHGRVLLLDLYFTKARLSKTAKSRFLSRDCDVTEHGSSMKFCTGVGSDSVYYRAKFQLYTVCTSRERGCQSWGFCELCDVISCGIDPPQS